jgi:hypothetical protein
MKHTNHALYHVFAHQTENDAQNANGSMFIDGNTIYSYGKHFPMARHTDGVILLTTDSYSNTTAKQLSQLGGAIPSSRTVYRVADVLANDHTTHLMNFHDYIIRYESLLEQAARARTNKEWLLDQAVTLASQANDYAQRFGVRHTPIDTSGIDLESIKDVVTARKLERKKQSEKLERKKQREQSKQIKDWQNNTPNVRAPSTDKVYLRIVLGNIQTSKHAVIPVSATPMLWDMVTTCRKEKQSYIPKEKLSVGNYSLTQIDASGNIKVNCHLIAFDQLKRIAKLLNYI